MLIDIALLTGIAIHNLSRELSLMLDRKYGLGLDSSRFPTHVTLKQAFSFDGNIKDLVQVFDAFCLMTPPPILRYSGIEAVPGRNDTTIIWLDIVPDETLWNMHKLLLELLARNCAVKPGDLDGDSWRFHTTLAQAVIDPYALPAIIADAKQFINQLNSQATSAVMLITPPGRPEVPEESVSYRIQRLSGPF